MQKQLRKCFLIAVCVLTLTTANVYAQNDLNVISNATNEQMKLIHRDVKVNDLDIEPIDTQAVKDTVVPDTKNEGKKVIGYFLRAMLGVALCAILLYFILLFVRKYYGSAFMNQEEEEYFESFDLTTPTSKQEALRTFLNRTK